MRIIGFCMLINNCNKIDGPMNLVQNLILLEKVYSIWYWSSIELILEDGCSKKEENVEWSEMNDLFGDWSNHWVSTSWFKTRSFSTIENFCFNKPQRLSPLFKFQSNFIGSELLPKSLSLVWRPPTWYPKNVRQTFHQAFRGFLHSLPTVNNKVWNQTIKKKSEGEERNIHLSGAFTSPTGIEERLQSISC